MSQERRIVIDGELPSRIEIEPTTAITSLTRWTPSDDAAVVDADTYNSVSRDPAGTLIEPAPGHDWPALERAIGSFTGVVLLRLDGHGASMNQGSDQGGGIARSYFRVNPDVNPRPAQMTR